MKVVIVAKTRMRSGACVGALSFDGRSLRLLAPDDAVENGHFNLDYAVGDVWDITCHEPAEIIPPHVESVVVTDKRRQPPIGDLCRFVHAHLPPAEGGVEVLYEGLLQSTRNEAQYIAQRTGVPPFSTMFWRPDRPLTRVVDQSVRIRYRYPLDKGGRTLTFVGFQEPPDEIPAGSLLRVSLAHWWRPQDKPDDELRCYVQLSGWLDGCVGAASLRAANEHSTTAGAAPTPWDLDDAEAQLRRLFGYDALRPAQRRVIGNLAAGRDTLAVMPTGSGKSICYQLPATLSPGLTVVVSPLIALMADQVIQLRELDIDAAYLNSTQAYEEQLQVMQRARQGRLRLLYVSPETLLRPEILRLLDDTAVDCLAIDEAHCISEWGHDFRPEYRQLNDVRQRLPGAVCLALTATATERVRRDITSLLAIDGTNTVVTSFDRPNLYLSARPRTSGWQQLSNFLAGHRGESGLIYCLTRNEVDRLTEALRDRGYPAIAYHAGLDDETRARHHRRFAYEEDAIVVATIAFGMGINKSNVRFVVHYGMPKDIESYYQQIGRAGRDGLRADCLLLYSAQDSQTARYHLRTLPPEERRAAELRLQAMVDYAETTGCRRRQLLRYFDEVYDQPACEMDDTCTAAPQEQVDLTIPAQKFLSCIKRTGEMFGASYIIDVLRGSRAQRLLENGHDQLSTYGIGRDYSKAQWQTLVRQFIERDLILRNPTHGGLSVTDAGTAVLRGEPFLGVISQGEAAVVGPTVDLAYDGELFELLRAKRAELAQDQNVPSYVIFSDRSLQEMATFFPQTDEEFLAVYGVGEGKRARYGDTMLTVLQAYCSQKGISSRGRPIATPARVSAGDSPETRRQIIAERFNEGQTIDELATGLNLQREAVISNLWKAAHFPPGLDQSHLCREVELDPQRVADLLAHNEAAEVIDVRRLYNQSHEGFTGETDWLLRLLLVNHRAKDRIAPEDRLGIREKIITAVQSLPGELPRSGLANFLRGNASGRVENYQDHEGFGHLPEEAYFELMAVIDILIADGNIVLGDDRRLYPA